MHQNDAHLHCDDTSTCCMLEELKSSAFRYVKSMRPLQRLRDEEWWGQTMAELRPKLQQSKQLQRRLGHPSSAKASTPFSKFPLPFRDITEVWRLHASPDRSLDKLSIASGRCLCQIVVGDSESRNEKHEIGLK